MLIMTLISNQIVIREQIDWEIWLVTIGSKLI